MKKLISIALCLTMLVGIFAIPSFAAEGDITFIEKESEWEYIVYCGEEAEGATAPEGWATGADSATWETGSAPFAGPAYAEYSNVGPKQTIFTADPFEAFIRKTFTVADASAVKTLTLSVIFDENPVIYINGTEVWAEGGFKDGGYNEYDLTDKISALKDGENVIAVSFENYGGGSTMDLELKGSTSAPAAPEAIVDGKANVKLTESYNSAGEPATNPWGAIGAVENLYDGNTGSVWGWDELGIYVIANFYEELQVNAVNLTPKNEGSMTDNADSHGTYKVEAWVDGAWVALGTVDALIAGNTLDTDVVTSKVKVTVTEWNNDNWKSIAELSFDAEEVASAPGGGEEEIPPVNGDAAVYAIIFSVVAILGMGIVVTKKVRV